MFTALTPQIIRNILSHLLPWCQSFHWAFVQCRKSYYSWGAAHRDLRMPCHETSWNLALCFCSLWQARRTRRTIVRTNKMCSPWTDYYNTDTNYNNHFVSKYVFRKDTPTPNCCTYVNNTFCSLKSDLLLLGLSSNNVLFSLRNLHKITYSIFIVIVPICLIKTFVMFLLQQKLKR